MPCSKDRQADFSSSIDIWVKACPPLVCSLCLDFWRLRGIIGTELDGELEEAVFVGRAGCPEDQGLDIADVFILVCDDYSWVRSVSGSRLPASRTYRNRCSIESP